MDIVTLGEILIDMFPAEVGRALVDVTAFRPKPGGAPANVAVAARRLGAETAFIGKVGEDAFGHQLMDILKTEGVETRGMRISKTARTTMAIIAMPDENTAEFVFYRNPGADLLLEAGELDQELLLRTRALHIGTLSLVEEPSRSATFEAVQIAREQGALISLDVNYRPSLWQSPEAALEQIRAMVPQVDLVKVNEVELALLQGEGLAPDRATKRILDQGPALCILTLGKVGSFCRTSDAFLEAPAFAVDTVDATGCGDAFIAGMLTQLTKADDWRSSLTQDKLPAMLRYANAVGALTAQTLGVIPALPTAIQVDEFLINTNT